MNHQTFPTREAWLAARRNHIGASESAAIFGVGYRNQSPWSVWESKVNPDAAAIDEDEDECLRIGRLIEPALRDMFEDETELQLAPPEAFEMHIHPDFEFLAATLDGRTTDAVPVELKNVGNFATAEWKNGGTPLKFEVQVQHQLAVTGAEFGFLLGLIAGQHIELRRIERNERFINTLIAKAAEFWELVESRTPPPLEPSIQCKRALERLHPDGNGRAIALPTSMQATAQRIDELKEQRKAIDDEITLRENEIRQCIGDATFCEFPDGSAYSWKTVHRSGFTVAPTSYRKLTRLKKLPRGVSAATTEAIHE